VGITALLINGVLAHWKESRQDRRTLEERKALETRTKEERDQADAKSSKERRKVMRQLKTIRPDTHCGARGCPLAVVPAPPSKLTA
jgi:hypothetical protein